MPPSFDGRGPAPGALSAYRFVLLSLIPLILIVLLGGIIEQAQAQSAIALVQDASKDAGVTSSSSLAFPAANIAGHWIGVVIRAGQAGETFTVSDSRKNTYHKAVQFNETGNGNTLGLFYAQNIAGGANTITVSDTKSNTLRFAILEYSGVATANALDVSVAAQGKSTAANSGNTTTTSSGDLLLGAILTAGSANFTAGSNYVIEESVPAEPNTKLIVEDQIGTAAGTASASASLVASDYWAAALAAFKAGSGTGSTAPSITSLSPTSGAVGTPVTITGTNFGTTQGSSTVTFNGTAATTFSSWGATSIAVTVPSGASTGNAVVKVSGVSSNGVGFTVISAPSITSLSPASGAVATPITITGTNFGTTQGSSTVTFNGTAATTFSSWSATNIGVTVPAGASTGSVVVTAGTLASNGVNFTVVTPPSITSLSPTLGVVGTPVTITGTNFGTTQGSSTVTFNGASAGTATSWNATSITVNVPAAATTGNVVVTVSGSAGNGAAFTVAPNITTVNPTSGAVATPITITGTNFGTTQGSSTVTFNGTAATPSNWSPTSIVAAVPTGASTGNVVVTVGTLASNGVNFTVVVPPSIISLSQSSGAVGTPITITGTNFGTTQGSSTVTFNRTAAASSSWSATSIVAAVPTGATTGTVIVAVSSVASNGVSFAVTGSPPTVSITSPANGATVAGTTTISASATAAGSATIASVQFQVDGNNAGSAVTSSPYTYSWITTSYANGSHSIAAVATDSSSNTTVSATVNVTVGNPSSGGVIPITLGWLDVTGQTQEAVCPQNSSDYDFATYCAGVVRAWGGGAADTLRNRLMFWGGGHTDYDGNEVYIFDLNALTVNRLNAPTNPPSPLCEPAYSDGSPSSRHTYGSLVYLPNLDKMYAFSGYVACSTGEAESDTWLLDLPTLVSGSGNPWTQMNPTTVPNGSAGVSAAAYDPNTELVFMWDTSDGLWSFNPSTDTYTELNETPTTTHAYGALDPTRKQIVTFGDGQVQKVSIASGSNYSVSTLTGSGCTGLMSSVGPGLAYDPVLDRIVGWPDFGGTVYIYDEDTDSCTTQSYSASSPPDSAHTGSPSTSNGTYGRFQYFPALGAYGLINDYNIDAHTLRLTAVGGGGGATGPNITNLSPTSGAVGTAIMIAGTNFGASQASSTVTFNGASAGTASSWGATSITVNVPAAATTGNVVVTVSSVASNAVSFTVTSSSPNITSLIPSSGVIGTSVTITGANFGANQGTSSVTFSGVTATPTSWSATSIATTVPVGTTTGSVVVTVSGVASNAANFEVTTGPGYALSFSISSDRDYAIGLQGATLQGYAYVFTSLASQLTNFNPTGIMQVSYWLDNSAMTGAPIHTGSAVPYDFAGEVTILSTVVANGWNTNTIADGTHTITQLVSESDGTSEADTATFTIENNLSTPISSGHYEYVMDDQNLYVYSLDNPFQLVQHVSLPQATAVRGAAAAPTTSILYISYGGDGGTYGTGSLLAFNLLTNTVAWTQSYTFGIDSFSITPDGNTIYMPDGASSGDGIWYVIDAATGEVEGSINTGMDGPHNTIVSLDGAYVFMGPIASSYLVEGVTSTNRVALNIGPLNQGVRPFTINGLHTFAFTTSNTASGIEFQVSDTETGNVLYTVPVPGFSVPASFTFDTPVHGISLSPDETEIYLIDTANAYVHVFDVSGLPLSAPVSVANIPLTTNFSGFESPCFATDLCPREGWLQHSRDGHYVFVGDSGDVIDTTTRQVVNTIPQLLNTRRGSIEIDWQNGVPTSTTTHYGLGYVTQAASSTGIVLVQHAEETAGTGVTATSQAFAAASTSGDLIMVTVKWGDQTLSASVTDSKGNTYTSVLGPTNWSGTSRRAQTFYAQNIIGGGAPITITATLSGTASSSLQLFQSEYVNANTGTPVDVVSSATGTGTTMSSGSVATNFANELLYGVAFEDNGVASAGTGFTAVSTLRGNLEELENAATAGAHSATAKNTVSANWFMHFVALRQ
ncbi:MAG: IPT/TIG domain-containing protein [Candidatus Acidiferrales bacterium]